MRNAYMFYILAALLTGVAMENENYEANEDPQ
jgi:hypothetical protein